MKTISIIGGTGMKELFHHPHYQDFGFQEISQKDLRVQTQYGNVPARIQIIERNGEKFHLQFIHRHHGLGTTPPHMLNNHANVMAAADCSPSCLISIQSVGSLVQGFPPGTLGLVEDFFDMSDNVSTFHNDDAVHTDVTDHFRAEYRREILPLLKEQGEGLQLEHVVAQKYGPHFETHAEIRALGILGASTVGMTLVPEAKLVAELGLPQLGLLVSSNWAAGCDPRGKMTEIDHHLVERSAGQVHRLIWAVIIKMLELV